MSDRSKRALLSTCALFAMAAAAPGHAQQAAAPSEVTPPEITSDDIVVTAQRRQERLQDVPIAITAINSEALADRGVADLAGISQVSPSLNVVAYPNSSDTIALNMRGQGTADPGQITKDGAVGIYIDGFYIARPQAALFDLGDPERVEVLRGPQGTLYGRNTTGGAINIITKKPSGELGGDMQLTFGSRNQVRALADLELPAIGNLAFKGTILYANQDGWVKNPGAANNFNDFGQVAGRIAARWTPTPELTVDYAWDQGRVTSTMPYYVNPVLNGTIPGYVADRDRTYAPIDIPTSKSNFVDHQLTLNWDATDNLTLRSLSAYRGFRGRQYVNYGLSQSLPGFPIAVEQAHLYRTKQYSQEFQIVGSLGDRIDYTGGLYYFREEGRHDSANVIDLVALGLVTPSTREIDALSVSKAAYMQTTLTPPVLQDRLKITLGARYTKDLRKATRNSTLAGAPVDVNVSNRRSFDNFSPTVNLAMQWTPDIMTYAKMAKGYKAGGSSEGGPDFRATFRPEKVTSWEVGLKSQFLDRMVTLNLAAFYNTFDDLQIDFTNSAQDTSIVSTSNAGKAQVKGVEAELIVQPSRDLTFRAAYTYLDPKLKQVLAPAGTIFDPVINPASPVDVGDVVTGYFTLPLIPPHALTVSADWTAFRSGGHEISLHGSFNYQARMYTSAGAGPNVPGRNFYRNTATDIVNARISWSMPVPAGESFKLSLFANNLLDERHSDFVIGTGDLINGFTSQTAPYSEPRVIGIEGRLTF